MKATVTAECIGCKLCVETCPDLFEMKDDELAHPKVDPIPADQENCAKEAADACPTSAIVLE